MKTVQFEVTRLIFVAMILTLCGCRNGWNPIANFKASPLMQPGPQDALKSQPMPKVTADERVSMQLAVIQSLEKKGEYDQAITACEELHKKAPKRTDVIHRLAVLHDKQGNPDQAAQYYAMALQREPQNSEILCDCGYGNYLRGNYAQAEENLRKSLQRSPRLARAHNNLGLVLARTNRYDAALAEFTSAGCSPPQARTNLAHAMIWDHNYAAAEEQLALSLQMDPSQAIASTSLGQVRSLRSKEQAAQAPVQPAMPPAAAVGPVQQTAARVADFVPPASADAPQNIVPLRLAAPVGKTPPAEEVLVAAVEKSTQKIVPLRVATPGPKTPPADKGPVAAVEKSTQNIVPLRVATPGPKTPPAEEVPVAAVEKSLEPEAVAPPSRVEREVDPAPKVIRLATPGLPSASAENTITFRPSAR